MRSVLHFSRQVVYEDKVQQIMTEAVNSFISIKNLIRLIATAGAAIIALTSMGFAQTPTPIGQYRDWAAYSYESSGGRVCYAITQPKDMQPGNVNRGDVYFFVSHRPGENVRNEISVIIGYPHAVDSTTTVEIGTDRFNLFTKDDGGWIKERADEDRLVASMRRGSNMIVKGTSRRGTLTTDTYSLLGVSAALKAVGDTCG